MLLGLYDLLLLYLREKGKGEVNCRKRREWHEGRRTEGGIRGS
jgi:hypothetical protein